jgi:hypothetical protein
MIAKRVEILYWKWERLGWVLILPVRAIKTIKVLQLRKKIIWPIQVWGNLNEESWQNKEGKERDKM